MNSVHPEGRKCRKVLLTAIGPNVNPTYRVIFRGVGNQTSCREQLAVFDLGAGNLGVSCFLNQHFAWKERNGLPAPLRLI